MFFYLTLHFFFSEQIAYHDRDGDFCQRWTAAVNYFYVLVPSVTDNPA